MNITIDEKLSKIADDHRGAEVFVMTDDQKFTDQHENLRSMDVARAAVAFASSKGVADPRISNGPTIVPIDADGQPLVTSSQKTKVSGYRAVFDIKSRLI